MVKFVKLNETFIKIVCEKSTLEEISSHFKFVQKNFQYTPQGKKGWDGVIKLINTKNGNFLSGLLKEIILKFKELGYHQFSFEGFENSISEYTENGILEALDEFKLPDDRQLREYQLNAILTCLLGQRRVCIAATNAGKSLILYAISRILIESDKKVLIVVPTVLLVSQIYADFESYAKNDEFDIEGNYHTITAGYAKNSPKPCYISTRDSISAIPKENLSEYLEKFDAILVDECLHPDSLISMADGTKMKISDIKVNDMVYTYNENTKLNECNKVLVLHKNLLNSIKNDMYKITLENGKELKLTGNHKVFTNVGWVEVQNLTGDEQIEIY